MPETAINSMIRYLDFKTVGCRFKSYCLLVGPGTLGGMPSVWGHSEKITRVLEKTTGKFRIAKSTSIEPDTSRLPALSSEPRLHWWAVCKKDVGVILILFLRHF